MVSIPCVSWGLVLKLAAEAPPERERPASTKSTSATTSTATAADLADRIRAYLHRVPAAVSGKGGHNATFYMAGRLVRGWGLSPDEALPFAAEWNQRCDPPWSEADLYRKLVEADKQPGIRGELRASSLDEYATPPPQASDPAPPLNTSPGRLRNFELVEVQAGETMRPVTQGLSMQEVLRQLRERTGGWPKSCGGILFVPDGGSAVRWIKAAADLFAWIDSQYVAKSNAVTWKEGSGFASKSEFFAYCLQNCETYESVEVLPHYPPLANTYYHHQPIPAGDGSHFARLIERFYPATPTDEDLIRATFLTPFWGGPTGQRPLIVYESSDESSTNGRGTGKSSVIQMLSLLAGGYIGLGLDNKNASEHEVRLLSPQNRTTRIVLFDNVKSLRASSASLEAMITSDQISGRQLYQGNGSRPNTLTWAMTFNSPSLGKDLAQRAVIVRLAKPSYTADWLTKTRDFIMQYRWQIIADIIAELKRPVTIPEGIELSRRAEWDAQVLAKCGDLVESLKLAAERRTEADDDNLQSEAIRSAIKAAIQVQFGPSYDPDTIRVEIPTQILFEKVAKVVWPDVRSPDHGNKLVYMYPIPELKKCRTEDRRFVVWSGKSTNKGDVIRRWDGI